MASKLFVVEEPAGAARVFADRVRLRTESRVQFVDLTDILRERVRQSSIVHGMALVQTRHTTTAVVVNENEPLLLLDLVRCLERWAPRGEGYRHNDLRARGPVPADESENGDAHCRAVLLGASESIAILDGALALGRWQRVFLLELDGPRPREVVISLMGVGGGR